MEASYNYIIGQRVRELRQEKNITQYELATRLHCSISLVAMLESGKISPYISTLSELSEIFDTSIYYLIGLTDETYRWPPKLAE
ncbi:hypothetical protein IMSAG049_00296 [Clostridiales bacterium]|nr:hypothetical protein IMSAG049_00296 [Clostridiales bacterium]